MESRVQSQVTQLIAASNTSLLFLQHSGILRRSDTFSASESRQAPPFWQTCNARWILGLCQTAKPFQRVSRYLRQGALLLLQACSRDTSQLVVDCSQSRAGGDIPFWTRSTRSVVEGLSRAVSARHSAATPTLCGACVICRHLHSIPLDRPKGYGLALQNAFFGPGHWLSLERCAAAMTSWLLAVSHTRNRCRPMTVGPFSAQTVCGQNASVSPAAYSVSSANC